MSFDTQSPRPNSTVTVSSTERNRLRKDGVPTEQSIAGKARPAGGVMTGANRSLKSTSSFSSSSKANTVQDSQGAATAPAQPGPTRQRRRPRKLNRDGSTAATPPASTATVPAASPTSAHITEIESLKSRVRGLEARVEELYKSTEVRSKSPRRRGKGRKSSSARSVSTVANIDPEPGQEEEADEELARAEEELKSARRDLAVYQPPSRAGATRASPNDSDTIQEMTGEGDHVLHNEGREVTLTGSYRIPLPSTVSMNDVKTIQSGVSAAQNVARSFLEKRRGARASNAPSHVARSASAMPKPRRKTNSMEVTREMEGKGWGEWFGGYSMAISRAVKSIEAEAAVESQMAQGDQARAGRGTSRGKMVAGGGQRPTAGG